MQVRAGRVAGHADVGNVLPRGHRVAGPHVDRGCGDPISAMPGIAAIPPVKASLSPEIVHSSVTALAPRSSLIVGGDVDD